jgi:glycerol-3-phosphate dehydrogenase
MRPRDFDRAVSSACDLLIVGGTCSGLAMAREAALGGLRATLVDPQDFGADASSYHLQIVPGGLHLLRRGRIGQARKAVRARRRLARTAPWLIRPLPFLAATERTIPGNRIAWRGIFKMDAWLGRHRNDGVEPELHLPPARLVSKTATLRLFPGVRREGLTGGVQWYDYQILDGHRFAVALAAGAEAAGAELLNHVDLVELVRDGDRISGVRLRDAISGAESIVRAGLLVDAAEGRPNLIPGHRSSRRSPNVRHLTALTSKPASDIALIAERQARRLVLMPSHGRALIGITEPLSASAGQAVTDGDVATVLSHANEAFPALGLTRGDIVSLHANVGADLHVSHTVTREDNVMTVTTANAAAALDAASQAVRLAAKALGKAHRARRQEKTLPGAGIADHEALLIESAKKLGVEVPPSAMRHLLPRYAEQSAAIVRLIGTDPDLREELASDHPYVAAEVVHAVRHEKAVRLSDVMRRLGVDEAESRVSRTTIAAVAAQELGWDEARVAAEIEAVDRTRQLTAS